MTASFRKPSSAGRAIGKRTPSRRSGQSRASRQPFRRLFMESLESRLLLSITPWLDDDCDDCVTFVGTDGADALYLRVTDGVLEFSEDGATDSYLRDLDLDTDGDQTLTISSATVIEVRLLGGDNTLFVDASLSSALTDLQGAMNWEGGDGNDTLVGPDLDSTWEISGADAGTLNSQIRFSSVENLTGGSDADTFLFSDGAAIAGNVDGGGSEDDTLDYSAYTLIANANLITGTATGTGGINSIEAVVGEDDPVLFIHGFGGSLTTDTSEEGIEYWLTHRGMNPESLQLETLADSYSDIVKTLQNVGYSLNQTVAGQVPLYTANWDWRVPVAPKDGTLDGLITNVTRASITDTSYDTGLDYLGYWIDKAANDWFTTYGTEIDTIDIIAHSTGGLVARSYIQSAAYGDGLPTVDDLVLVGVPNEGVATTWNLLQNDFSDKTATRLAGSILAKAYDLLVSDGRIIYGPGESSITGVPSQVDFIRQYVGTLEDLLPVYAFIDTNGDGINESLTGEDANNLLLDLNADHAFADKTGTTTVVYSTEVNTKTQVKKQTGLVPSAGLDNEILPFEHFLGHLPAAGEVWYQDLVETNGGDGTVPFTSALPSWLNPANDHLKIQAITAAEAGNAVEHTGLVQDVTSQSKILDSIGVTGYTQADISTGLSKSTFESLETIIQLGFLDSGTLNQARLDLSNLIDVLADEGVDVLTDIAHTSGLLDVADAFGGLVLGPQDGSKVVIVGTAGEDNIVLAPGANAGTMVVSSLNGSIEPHTFNNPSSLLRILLGAGDDTIDGVLVDPSFTGDLIFEDPGTIVVTSAMTAVGDMYLTSGRHIIIQDNANIATDGKLSLTANAYYGLDPLALTPIYRELDAEAKVIIGTARIDAGDVYISSSSTTAEFAKFRLFEDSLLALLAGTPVAELQTTALGEMTLTFYPATDQNNGPTIHRSSGSWQSERFEPGMTIKVIGSHSNDGDDFVIKEVTGDTLVLEDDDVLVEEEIDAMHVELKQVVTDILPQDVPLVATDENGDRRTSLAPITANGLSNLMLQQVAKAGGILDFASPVDIIKSTSVSEIRISSGAEIVSDGVVDIGAVATSSVLLDNPSMILGFSYVDSAARAKATIESGAVILAGGNFELTADVTNKMHVTSTTLGSLMLSTAQKYLKLPGAQINVAYGNGFSESVAFIADNAVVTANDVTVRADNSNDFKVAAVSTQRPGGGLSAAVGVAISDVESHAKALVSGEVEARGNMTIGSDAINSNNDVMANAVVKSSIASQIATAVASKVEAIRSKMKTPQGGLGLAGGVALAESLNEAEAQIGSTARLASHGDLTVASTAKDNFQSTAVGGAKGGAKVSLGGAVAISDYQNLSRAFIADDAIVNACGFLDVSADSIIPNQITVDETFRALLELDYDLPTFDFSDPAAFYESVDTASIELEQALAVFSDLVPYLTPQGILMNNATSFVAASAEAGPKGFALSGTVDLLTVSNRAEAWIGTGALVNQDPAFAAGGQKVSVSAVGLIETVNIGGIPGVHNLVLPATKSGGSSVGGTYGGITYTNTAKAFINDGAVVSAASDVSVQADATNFTVNVMESGGKAKDFGVTGSVAVNDFSVTALAYIEDTATVTAGHDVIVDASSKTTGIIVTGTVSSSSNVGVGAAVAWNEVTGISKAFLGNVEDSSPILVGNPQLALADNGTGPATISRLDTGSFLDDGFRAGQHIRVPSSILNTGVYRIESISGDGKTITLESANTLSEESSVGLGLVTVGTTQAGNDVKVHARNDERLYAVSIAAAAITTTPPAPDPLAGKSASSDTAAQPSQAGQAATAGAQTAANAKSKGGIGISGSVSINKLDETVYAFVGDHVVVDAGNQLKVHAINEAFVLSVSGAASLNMSMGSGGMALAGAFTLNNLDRDIRAYTKDAVITAHSVDVNAETIDKVISVTAGGGGSKLTGAAAVTGSVSINEIDNTVESGFWDGTIVTATGDVSAHAADHLLLVSVAGGFSISGRAGIGAAVDVGVLNRTVRSHVGPSAILNSGGNVAVTAQARETIVSTAVSLGVGTKALGLVGSASSQNLTTTVEAYVGANATVTTANSLLIDADNSTFLVGVGGGAAYGKQVGFGASLANSNMDRSVRASMEDGAAITALGAGAVYDRDGFGGQGVVIDATASDDIYLIAAGGGVSTGTVGGAASVVVDTSFSDVAATIGDAEVNADNAAADAQQSVKVRADHDLKVVSVAGSVGASKTAGIGIAADVEVIDTKTRATIAAGALVNARKDVNLQVEASKEIWSFAVGLGFASTAGVAGSASVLTLSSTTKAGIEGSDTAEDPAVVTTGGEVWISASSNATLRTAAGAGAVGSTAGLGISNSTVVHTDTLRAFVGEHAVVSASGGRGLGIEANSWENMVTVAVGGAVATGQAGIAGSAAVTVLNETTKATIAENAVVNSGSGESDQQSVLVLASDRTSHTGIGGAGAFGKSTGIGAGVDVGVFTKTTEARIASGAEVGAQNNVQVQANSSERVFSVAAGGGVSQGAGIAGAADVYVLNVTTRSLVEGAKTVDSVAYAGATVEAGGTVVVAAEEKTTLDVISGNIAFGKSAGIGGAAGVPIVVKTTEASIGNVATVDGKGGGSGVDVKTGEFGVTFEADSDEEGEVSPFDIGNSDVTDPSLTSQRIATPAVRQGFKGVTVSAVNQDDIETYGVGVGLSTTASFQLSATVNVMTSTTRACIGAGAQVNRGESGESGDQSVLVAAGNDYYHMGIAGAVAGTFNVNGVAMSPGAGVAVVANTTEASIGNGAQVDAKRDIEVRAHAAEKILSIAAAVAGGGNFAGAGAVSVIVLNNETQAYIGNGAVVHAGGNILVSAADATEVDVVAGALGVGMNGGGAGVGVGLIVINKDTQAYIGQNAIVDAQGNSTAMTVLNGTLDDSGNFGKTSAADNVRGLAVAAVSSEDVFAVAAAGGVALWAGVAGGVTVEVIDSNTRAYIDAGAIVNGDPSGAHANQDVHVTAANDVTMLIIDGAIAGGLGAGVAGGVDVGIVRNDTTAYIAGSDVRARRDIAVNALADRNIQSFAISAGVGAVGLGAAVSVYALGGNLQDTYSFDKNDDGTVQPDESQNVLLGSDGTTTSDFADSQVGVSGILDLLGSYSDGGDVQNATSSARTSLDDATPESPVGGAAGATVADMQIVGTQTVPRGTVAFIRANAGVTAGRHVDLDARERIDLQVIAGGLGAGGMGVGASISIVSVDEPVRAFIASGATVQAGTIDDAGGVRIDSRMISDISGLAVTAGIGGSGSLAGSVIVINDSSYVAAYTEDAATANDGARILSADQVLLTADRDAAIHASTGAAAGDLTAGLGAAVTITTISGKTTARIGNQTQIGVAGDTASVQDLEVKALSNASINGFEDIPTMAVGLAVAGGGAGAAGVVVAKINADTESTIGSDTTVLVGGLVSVQAESESTVDVDADGGAIGAAAIGGMVVKARIEGTTRAHVGDRATLVCGSLDVSALAKAAADVDTIAAAGGLVAGSGSVALATVNPTVAASIGIGADVHADNDISLTAAIEADVEAKAQGYSVAGLAVGVSWAEAKLEPDVDTYIGREAKVFAGRDITLQSLHNVAENRSRLDKGARAEATASGGGLLAGNGAVVRSTVVTNVDAFVGQGALTEAGGDVEIASLSNIDADALADAVTIAAAAGSKLSAEVVIDNHTHAYIDSSEVLPAKINAGRNFTLLADSFSSAYAYTNAASGGAFAGGAASSDIDLTNDTQAWLAPHATVIATDTATLLSQSELVANADTVLHSGAALALGDGQSTIVIDSEVLVTFSPNSTLEADHVDAKACVLHIDADAVSDTKTYALDSTAMATSGIDMTTDAKVEVSGAASIKARQSLSLTAWQDAEDGPLGGSDLNSNAEAQVAGATGRARTTANGTITANTHVNIASGAELTAADVALVAHSAHHKVINSDATAYTLQNVVESVPLIGWLVKAVTKSLKVQSTNETLGGMITDESAVTLDGVLNLLSQAERDLIVAQDESGNISFQGNIPAQVVGDDVVVSPVINDSAGAVLIVATTNAGGGELRGRGSIVLDRAYDRVDIQNESDKNLRINEIIFWSEAAEDPMLSFISSNDWDYATSIGTKKTSRLNIQNCLGTTVHLDAQIRNMTGQIAINNPAGSIVSSDDAVLYAQSIALTATGNVGQPARPLQLWMQDGALDVSAGDDVSLDVHRQPDQQTRREGSDYVLTTKALISSITAGGSVQLALHGGQAIVEKPVLRNDRVFLFSVAAEFQNDLQNDILSDALRQEFERRGIPVTALEEQFSMAKDFQEDLASGRVTEALRGEFSQNGISLSDDVSIITTAEDHAWTIHDIGSNRTFVVVSEDLDADDWQLTVYEPITSSDVEITSDGDGWQLQVGSETYLAQVKTVAGEDKLTVSKQFTYWVQAGGSVDARATYDIATVTAQGDVTITKVPDLVVSSGATISAPKGSVFLYAGDHVDIRANSRILAGTAVSIQGDYQNADPNGAHIEIQGQIHAPITDITAGGDGNVFFLTNVAAGNVTTVQTRAGGDLVQVGPRLSDIQGQLIVQGGAADRLIVSDGDDQASGDRRIGQLTCDRIRGFGMPADAWIEYVDFRGTSTPPELEIQLLDADGYELTVLGTSVPTHLSFGEGNGRVVFDASSQLAPISHARLNSEGTILYVSNLGPIDEVSLSQVDRVVLELGAGNDLLEINVSLADVRIDVRDHGGDDMIVVQAIGHTTIIDGGAGFDQVQVEIPGDPTGPDHHKLFEYLVVTAETLIVDNRSYDELVHWTLAKAANVLRAEAHAVLCTEGVDAVHLVASEARGSTLALEGLDGRVILDGNQVELTAKAPILTPGDFLNNGFTYTLGTLVGVTDVASYGDFVYTASPGNDTVGVFLPGTGNQLQLLQVLKDGHSGVDALAGVWRIVLSDDGKYVYVAAALDHALTVFQRDEGSGLLTFVQHVRDGADGVHGLQGVSDIALHGNNLYAAGHDDGALAVFRAETDGSLTFLEAIGNTLSTNVALGKTARQSSTYNNLSYAGPNRAVDGIMDPVWRSNATNSISHTAVESGAWWEVDLAQAYQLDHVRLFDRSGYPQQLSDFFVTVYRDGGEIWKSPKISRVSVSGGGSLRVDLPAGTVGDRIRIQNDNDVNRVLVLVECEVFTRGVRGLVGINSVTVSADSTRVYTTADSGTVSVFGRNASGGLAFLNSVSAAPGTSQVAEVVSNGKRILDVLADGSSTLQRFDVSSAEAAVFWENVEPGLGNLRAIQAIPDPSLLLWEGFGNGDAGDLPLATSPYAGRWTVVDQGTVAAPSHWHVSGGTLVQDSNIYGGDTSSYRLGTYLYYEDEANDAYAWQDYELTVDLRCRDNDGIGVLFRYTDPYNYYKLEMDRDRTFRAIVRVENGEETQLARTNSVSNYAVGQWFQLRITVTTEDGGARIRVLLNETEVFNVLDVLDNSSLTHGTVAMYCWGQAGADFDNIQVRQLPSNPAKDFSRVYVLGENTVGAYKVDPASFTLIAMDTANFAGGSPVGLHVTDRKIFIADSGTDLSTGGLRVLDEELAYDFEGALNQSTISAGMSVAVADLNKDGDLDIVLGVNAGVVVYKGRGDATFWVEYDWVQARPYFIVVADLNGDGNLDVVTANMWSNNVSVTLGYGDGSFAAPVSFATGQSPRSVAVGDLNGDGILDLVTANSSSHNVSVLLGDGSGGFHSAVNFPTGQYPQSVALADLNGNGKLAIVTAVQNGVSVAINESDEDGLRFSQVIHVTAPNSSSVAIADLDRDGLLDIVSLSYLGGLVSMLLNKSDGSTLTFAPAMTFSTGLTNSNLIVVADLNLDGELDVVTSCQISRKLSVLLGIGGGAFAGSVNLDTGPRLNASVAVGDLNGDGFLDLVIPAGDAYSGDYISMWQGTGNSYYTFGALATTTAQEARLLDEQPLVLSGLQSVAVSPDGGFVYAVNADSHALVALGLDEAGALSVIDSYVDGFFNQDLLVDGLNGARHVALNPMCDQLYVLAPGDQAIAVFQRNRSLSDVLDGTLTFRQRVDVGAGANGLVVSPDGDTVYTSGPAGLAAWAQTDGLLASSPDLYGLAGADDWVIQSATASGGTTLLLLTSDAINTVRLLMDSGSGLSPLQDISGIADPSDLALSSDGEFLFIADRSSGGLLHVAKQGADRSYTVIQTFREGFQGVHGIAGANGVSISPDGEHVYVTGGAGDSVAVFQRDPATGRVRLVQVLRSRGDLNLKSPNSIAVAPDGTVVVGTSQAADGSRGGAVTLTRNPLASAEIPFAVSFESVQALTITTGDGDDFIEIIRTSSGSATEIRGGLGDDTVRIRGADALGPVSFVGGDHGARGDRLLFGPQGYATEPVQIPDPVPPDVTTIRLRDQAGNLVGPTHTFSTVEHVIILPPPVGIALVPWGLPENADIGGQDLEVGQFDASSQIDGAVCVFSLVPGSGDDDNGRFVIVDDRLFLKQGTPLDYESQAVYAVRARVSNGFDHVDRQFVVAVMDVNEAPELEQPIPNQSATANVPFQFQFAAETFRDPDAGDVLSYSATLGEGLPLPSWLSFDTQTRTFRGRPGFTDDGQLLVVVRATDSGTPPLDRAATFELTVMQNAVPWQNPTKRWDVDASGSPGDPFPADVLTVINFINSRGVFQLPAPPSSLGPPPYVDVTGDGWVTAADVLDIINFINGRVAVGGEAEPTCAAVPPIGTGDVAARSTDFALLDCDQGRRIESETRRTREAAVSAIMEKWTPAEAYLHCLLAPCDTARPLYRRSADAARDAGQADDWTGHADEDWLLFEMDHLTPFEK